MPIDSKTIASDFDAELRSTASNAAAASGAAAALGVPEDFCAIWPKAKPILEVIVGIAIFIPGVGAAAGSILKVLIKVAETVHADQCKA